MISSALDVSIAWDLFRESHDPDSDVLLSIKNVGGLVGGVGSSSVKFGDTSESRSGTLPVD